VVLFIKVRKVFNGFLIFFLGLWKGVSVAVKKLLTNIVDAGEELHRFKAEIAMLKRFR
jgi:hypothetical protein